MLRFRSCIPSHTRCTDENRQPRGVTGWTAEHRKWIGIGVALLAIYAIGIPVLALAVLARARRDGLEKWRPAVGFLFNGFKPNYYYW